MSKPTDLENAFEQLSIGKYENKRDQLSLSKRVSVLVDTRPKCYNAITFSCRRDHILIEFRDRRESSKNVVYAGADWNSEVVFSNVDCVSKYEPEKKVEISVKRQCKLIKSEDYEKMAFDDLAIAVKTPKMTVGCFTFEYCAEKMPREIHDVESSKRCYEKMRVLLSSFDHKLSVRKLKLVVEGPDDVMAILPHMMPVFLREITIKAEKSSEIWLDQEKINRIVNSEQWMKAITLLRTQNIFAFFPMENLMNFERLHIKECFVDTELLLKLRELFSKSANLFKCYIESRDKFDAEVLAAYVGEPAPSTKWSSNVRRYQLPDTEKILKFQFHGDTISIRRYPNDIILSI
ncbi:hypothetical protein GCK72_008906 [Caenorhabditis remanei]|uniref:DUF38 domain-containing protein n=1 Tax=Caenorhabditis remanei TaxID=31234 RepID=A0A6A5GZZ9_CAERE|nr:hypothetical protein GCK72_008906 [Caenorhabditis remanei]KAF1760657.1 hypothetical protein GCK72_008906 [Caenorhabditis remanei]